MEDLNLLTMIKVVDNQPISDNYITHQTFLCFLEPKTLQIGLLNIEEITLFVLSSMANTIILGYPWLHRDNPYVSGKQKEFSLTGHIIVYSIASK